MHITIKVHAVADRMPDVDTDVLLWADGERCSMLGAYLGDEEDGGAGFVDAQGAPVEGVTHWAEMPELPPQSFDPRTVDHRKPCTCDGAGRGPGRECVVKAGGTLGELWRCAQGYETTALLQRCASDSDGDCVHAQCPQLRDNEPETSGRSCPLFDWKDPHQ